jgi:hypothetical protein
VCVCFNYTDESRTFESGSCNALSGRGLFPGDDGKNFERQKSIQAGPKTENSRNSREDMGARAGLVQLFPGGGDKARILAVAWGLS